MMNIELRHDHERGCGWRKPGGKYLIGGKLCAPCGKLPHMLDLCPTCGHGIKPTRGWTWIGAKVLLGSRSCTDTESFCVGCLLRVPPEWAGLLWIGERFYTPDAFIAEAARLGICRRIARVPKDLVIGETLVLLAARNIYCQVAGFVPHDVLFNYKPGIFAAFVPTALEYVVKGNESEEELERLVRWGFTLVRIERGPKSGGGSDEGRSEGARRLGDVDRPAAVRPAEQRAADDLPPGGSAGP
jgi:hypothetical protein